MIHKHTKVERIILQANAGSTAADALTEAIIMALETNTQVDVTHNGATKVVKPDRVHKFVVDNQI